LCIASASSIVRYFITYRIGANVSFCTISASLRISMMVGQHEGPPAEGGLQDLPPYTRLASLVRRRRHGPLVVDDGVLVDEGPPSASWDPGVADPDLLVVGDSFARRSCRPFSWMISRRVEVQRWPARSHGPEEGGGQGPRIRIGLPPR